MDAIVRVDFVPADFSDAAAMEQRLAMPGTERPALVMSEMAPNMSGMAEVDNARSMHLVELELDFARSQLRPGGDLRVEVLQGRGFQPLLQQLRTRSATVAVRKSPASRSHDAELHLLSRHVQA